MLRGDAGKTRRVLGWTHRIGSEELVREMVGRTAARWESNTREGKSLPRRGNPMGANVTHSTSVFVRLSGWNVLSWIGTFRQLTSSSVWWCTPSAAGADTPLAAAPAAGPGHAGGVNGALGPLNCVNAVVSFAGRPAFWCNTGAFVQVRIYGSRESESNRRSAWLPATGRSPTTPPASCTRRAARLRIRARPPRRRRPSPVGAWPCLPDSWAGWRHFNCTAAGRGLPHPQR